MRWQKLLVVHASRISCLSIAAEIVRIVGDQEPAFETIRQLLESNPAARQTRQDTTILGSSRRNLLFNIIYIMRSRIVTAKFKCPLWSQ
jgi:hypothetical protein